MLFLAICLILASINFFAAAKLIEKQGNPLVNIIFALIWFFLGYYQLLTMIAT